MAVAVLLSVGLVAAVALAVVYYASAGSQSWRLGWMMKRGAGNGTLEVPGGLSQGELVVLAGVVALVAAGGIR